MMLANGLVFTAVVASGIAAGGMLVFLVGILPIREQMGALPFVQFHQLSSPLIDRVIPPGIVVSAVTALGAVLVGGLGRSAVAALLIGASGSAVVIAISLAVNFPINKRVRSFALDAVPPEHRELFLRWHRFHAIRTPFALAAFGAYVAAALAS
jgi:Domain of unknown function (DUF1772)